MQYKLPINDSLIYFLFSVRIENLNAPNLSEAYDVWFVHRSNDTNWFGLSEIGQYFTGSISNALQFFNSNFYTTLANLWAIKGESVKNAYLPQDVATAQGASQILPPSGPSIIYQCG